MDIGDTRRENGEDTEDARLKLVIIGSIADFGEYISQRQGQP
jgi:hypothetical protein